MFSSTSASFFVYMASTLTFTKIRTANAQIDGNYSSGLLPIQNETSMSTLDVDVNPYHYACQPGWTGTDCGIRFESCSQYEGAGDHHCYHGGQCIEGLTDKYGNEQLFCDCSNAYDAEEDVYYVGKYCEHRSINYCHYANTHFCVNGGECNDNYGTAMDSGPPCICNEDFTGPHCEFKTNSVPVCDLACQNGGHCVYEEPTGRDRYQYWATKNKKDFMYCSCPDGFDGPTCEIEKSSCGEGHCFHGSKCVPILNDDVGYFCDCNAANFRSGVSYGGRFCQYEATMYCTQGGNFFCVNGGSCKTDPHRLHEGCDCLPGYEGFSCEFRVHTNNTDHGDDAVQSNSINTNNDNNGTNLNGGNNNTINNEGPGTDVVANLPASNSRPVVDDPDYIRCDLNCMNDGVCRKGAKSYENGVDDIIREVGHLNISHTVNFEHCVCPQGFVGLQCEHEIKVCGENEHHCLHGSSCVNNDGFHSCDCSTTSGDDAYAGNSCEHKATTICESNNNDNMRSSNPLAKPPAFCVNGATCVREVSSGEKHPGCICSPGYYGPHCELRNTDENINEDEIMGPNEVDINESVQQQHHQQQQHVETEVKQEQEREQEQEQEQEQGSGGLSEVHLNNNSISGNDNIGFGSYFVIVIVILAVGGGFLFVRNTLSSRSGFRDDPSVSPTVHDEEFTDDQIPQRAFQSSSSTDMMLAGVMESSDSTPLAKVHGRNRRRGGSGGYRS